MKREELRNKYIREICDKNNKALRRLAETNSDDINYLAELANDIEREVGAMLNEDKVVVGFKRLSDDAILPTKAHPTDSGYDLYASEDVIIEPGETTVVPTGIAVQLPAGYEAQVRPRSGVTSRTKLRVQLGTIDQDYRGEIGVIVDNIYQPTGWTDTYPNLLDGTPDNSYTGDGMIDGSISIKKNDRIAQLVIQPLPAVESYEIDGDLDDTERGSGGFGSTGVSDSVRNFEVCSICKGHGILFYPRADETCQKCDGTGMYYE